MVEKMYHSKPDQRSVRSRQMIYDGLVKLIDEKNFASITVTDLVKAAKVGRTTFYRNFEEIEDVLWMRCDQVVEGFITYLLDYRLNHPSEPVTNMLKPVLHYFYQHSEMIEMLMKARRVHIFEEIFRSRVEPFKPMFLAYFGIDEDYVDYLLVMRIGAITKILTHWIATGKKQTPDELADKLGAISHDMSAFKQFL